MTTIKDKNIPSNLFITICDYDEEEKNTTTTTTMKKRYSTEFSTRSAQASRVLNDRRVFFSVSNTGIVGKENPSSLNRSQNHDLHIRCVKLEGHSFDSCWETSDFLLPSIPASVAGKFIYDRIIFLN